MPMPILIEDPRPVARLKDWQLAAELLPQRDPECEFYTLFDIAPCVGNVTPHILRQHARDLWRQREGHYRLSHEKAIALIKRYLLVGKKRFARAALERMVEERRRQPA